MNWIGWALLSALFAAATALLAKVGVAHVDSNLATALRTSVVVIFAWGIALTWARPEAGGGLWAEVRGLDTRTLAFLTLSGLATGLSWIYQLLQGAAVGACVARGSAGQAERAAGDGVCVAAARREDERCGGGGRTADHGRRGGDGAGVTGMLGIQ